jgi:undecaprenyl diphosphate synthase
MDGNGRWAERQGLPRIAGHEAGAAVVRRVVEVAPRIGIQVLTLYAFSADNWRRPRAETAALMGLFRRYLAGETERCVAEGVELTVLGRRDRVPADIAAAIGRAEAATRGGGSLHLRLAIDYSGRDAIRRAALALASRGARACDLDEFGDIVATVDGGPPVPPADLIVRTGGERRLSDFLLWEAAYAELVLLDVAWPEFTPRDLAAAVAAFRRRERRFGGLGRRDAGEVPVATLDPRSIA